MAIYIEATREKIFPLSIVVSIMITAIGLFVLVNAAWNLVENAQGMMQRGKSNLVYWLRFKMPEGNLSAYATDTKPSGEARAVPVLLYHGESSLTGNTPLPVFVDQMKALKKDGWHTITLAQLRDFMKEGKPVPEKSFLLTFDDGRRDTYYPADPVLKDMGFSAVMFVITGFSLPPEGKPSSFYLDKNELQYMIDSGRWELQSHGDLDHGVYHVQSTTDLSQEAKTVDGHFMTNKFWNDRANRFEDDTEFAQRIMTDLTNSKDVLTNTFDLPVYTYAFPFNDFGNETVNFPGAKAIVAQVVPSVYTFAFYQTWPANGDTFNYPDPDEYMIKRFEPKSDWSGKDLLAALKAAYPKELPYVSTNFGQEWVGIWGDVESSDGKLALAAAPSTSGATAFLNGSGWWKDYELSADVRWIAGNSISLLARNSDDLNYLGCAFTDRGVALEKHTPEGEVPVATRSLDFGDRASISLGIRVQGNSGACIVNGQPVVSGTFSGLEVGGIGFEVWDSTHGIAKSSISRVSVTPI